MSSPVSIAYLGKGGTGKSILSALTGKIAISMKKKVLLIDADPAMGLTTALGITSFKTIGQAREEIIKQAKIVGSASEKERLSDIINYLFLEAIYQSESYSMLVMGVTNSIGCYCPINNLLREMISRISENYDVIIIDGEAGIEQINRQVTENVQFPIILTDNSKRGIKTALLAEEAIYKSPKMTPIRTGVIFNRIEHENLDLINEISDDRLIYYGSILTDWFITDRDARGLSPLEVPEESMAFHSLIDILRKHKILIYEQQNGDAT